MVQVIDMDTDKIVKSIPTVDGVHNTSATPDGRYIAAGMVGARTLSVIDTSTDEIAWSLGPEEMIQGVRPMGFETNPDGSTKRIFANISSLDGFVIVDFEKREVVDRIVAPRAPLSKYIGVRNSLGGEGRGRAPDGRPPGSQAARQWSPSGWRSEPMERAYCTTNTGALDSTTGVGSRPRRAAMSMSRAGEPSPSVQ